MGNVLIFRRFTGGGPGGAVIEIARQLKNVTRAQLPNVEAIDPEDEWTWSLLLRGPVDSPYTKGLFSLTLKFPQDYPNSPPAAKFNTPVFHPNVNSSGRICWSSSDSNGSQFQAPVLISAICALLEEPNADSPLNSEAAALYTKNKAAYILRASSETEKYALY